jgi:hypothetical protein
MASKVFHVTAIAVGVVLIAAGVLTAFDVASGIRGEQTLSLELVVVGLAFCAFGVGGQLTNRSAGSQISTLRATRIEVVDDHGNPRILISAGREEPALGILDQTGNLMVRLGLTEAKPDLVLWETGISGKKLRVRVCSLPDGTAGFVVFDAEGRPRGFLTNLNDSVGLTLFNKDTKKRAELVANNSGSRVALQDDNEVARAELYTGATWNLDMMEESFLKAAGDGEAKRNIVPPVIDYFRDQSGLALSDAKGLCRAGITVKRVLEGDASNIIGHFATYDDSGQMDWQAPAGEK